MDAPGPDGWVRDESRYPWRQCFDHKEAIEILLPCGRVTLIDSCVHKKIAQDLLSAHNPKELNTYVYVRRYDVGRHMKAMLLHVYLFPDLIEPRDHINRNKLDNRSANLRSGLNGINQRNCKLKNGGVSLCSPKRSYVAYWSDWTSVQRQRNFPWKNYPNRYLAHKAALEHRKREAAIAEAKILEAQAAAGGVKANIPKGSRKKLVTSTGEKNLTYREIAGAIYLRGYITINTIPYTKVWVMSQFESEKEALKIGVAWREQVIADNPKLPRRKGIITKRRKIEKDAE